MPSTLTGRAINGYQAQALPNNSKIQFDRTSSAATAAGRPKKETFADVLREQLQKHARD